MKKFITVLSLLSIAVFLGAILSTSSDIFAADVEPREDLIEHDFGSLLPNLEISSYISYSDFRTMLNGYISSNPSNVNAVVDLIDENILDENKIIRIDTAQELYRFSVDVSFLDSIKYELETTKLPIEVRNKMLDLDYALGNHVDYSVMKSRQFIPIGYSFETIDNTPYEKYFTGTFNGMGFTISNLAVAGYNAIHIIEGEDETEIETVISPYYSMFTHNSGVITNFGLVNPTFELRVDHENLTKAANIVGLNEGLVEKVYVVDERSQADAGFRMKTPVGATTSQYEAAGLVYENAAGAVFKDSYFAGRLVVNQSNVNAFNVQPVLFKNSGTTAKLVYDNQLYLTSLTVGGSTVTITPVNNLHIGEATNTLKGSSSLGNAFFYYPTDGYPKLVGLAFVDNYFEIHNAFEFRYFTLMITFNGNFNGKAYRQHNYRLVNHINIDDIAPNSIKTIAVEFEGILSGESEETENYHIYNLKISDGVLNQGAYHLGLFSLLKGEVKDINFKDFELTYTNSSNYTNIHSYIGAVAARMDDGKITNVMLDLNTNLGNEMIGRFSYGAFSGYASGTIYGAYVEGEHEMGNHAPNTTSYAFEAYIGGIVGRTANKQLKVYNALNRAKINSFGTTGSAQYNANTQVYVGGVIGYVENIVGQVNDFGLITNEGEIVVRHIQSNRDVKVFIGGVIGESSGAAYILNDLSGIWVNKGKFNLTLRATSNPNETYLSGVVNSSHNASTEFIYLQNKKPADLLITTLTNFKFATVLYHRGTGGITLSQSYNEMDVEFSSTTPYTQAYSGLFHTEGSAENLLRFVENKGNIIFRGFTTNQNFIISGITTATNTDFLNVIQSGEIAVYNITFNPTTREIMTNSGTNNNDQNIWVSGITYLLSSGKYIKNSMNNGAIYVADINSTSNIYIAGIVNRNQSGDLHNKDTDNIPKATYGILNTVNNANISSTLPDHYGLNNHGIKGRANTYVGGIVTFNGADTGGSIQDTINMADITFSHIVTSGESNSSVTFASSSNGGYVTNYRRGIILGGIAAAVSHGYSRIYDSVNSGNIIAYSKYFARTGGVLAIALRDELEMGNVNTALFTGITATNDDRTIINSVLRNGLNYGNIAAVTENLDPYSTGNSSTVSPTVRPGGGTITYLGASGTTTNTNLSYKPSTTDRPGITSSSGGVIGYGLSTMSKMLNHGQISSTDVAGGVVGATVVVNSFHVKIDTAINYGTVRAINNSSYGTFDKKNFNYDQIKNAFYDHNASFIIPTIDRNQMWITVVPDTKRGIGGVFGRLQRREQQYMRTADGIFDFVVNMDPNVDMIGRLDQYYNFSTSNTYFVFDGALYYSAKLNDTTQAVFNGHRYKDASNAYPITRRTATRTVIEKAYYKYREVGNTVQKQLIHIRYQVKEFEVSGGRQYLYYGYGSAQEQTPETVVIRRDFVANTTTEIEATGWVTVNEPYPGPRSENFPVKRQVISESFENHNPSVTSGTYFLGSNPVPFISEDESFENDNQKYVYHPEFIMRDDSTMVDKKPITSYIYYVENDILGERFKSSRPNGMYVLATSAGSQLGATLPANIKLDQIYQLNSYLPYHVDYENIPLQYKEQLEEEVLDEYLSLFQTSLNDKSKLLTTNQFIKVQNTTGSIKLYGNSASVDNGSNTITLRLNRATTSYTSNQIVQMIEAVLPTNAKIAKTASDAGFGNNLEAYRQALLNEGYMDVSNLYRPEFTLTNVNSGTYEVGEFVSYSQAALNLSSLFVDGYYSTTYTVYIEYYNNATTIPGHYQHQFDNGTINTRGTPNTSTDLELTGSFTSILRNVYRINSGINTSIITLGYDIKDSFKLQYNNNGTYIDVDAQYYSLTTIPFRNTSGSIYEFEYTVNFSPELKGGSYRIVYDFGQGPRYLRITKAKSTENSILSISHETEQIIYNPTTTFTTNIDFDYDLLSSYTGDYGSTINSNIPAYLDNYEHNIPFLNHLNISKFARLENVMVSGPTYNNGYKTYTVTYQVISENGNIKPYTHYIVERPFTVSAVYKDNISVNMNSLTALREAVETVFGINFQLNNALINQIMQLESTSSYQHFDFVVTAKYPNGNTMPSNEIVGISYSVSNNLNIHMSDATIPGTYTITMLYIRDGRQTTITPNIVITKNQGTSSYLKDIRFAENSQDTDYPNIYISNASGAIVQSTYLPSAYYAGIDYDGADLANIRHFRVDGTVANIPLNEYSPLMIDFLPPGATIARLINPVTNQYTIEIGKNSSAAEKELLNTNFTLKYDGSEPTDEEEVIITYRVTSEDGLTQTYYHTTVMDKTYNLSIIFEVYYGSINPEGLLEVTRFYNKTFVIMVTNFTAKDSNGNLIPNTTLGVPNFPQFASVGQIESTVNMFYSAIDPNIYRYRFGRNKSGFYNFDVLLPEDELTYQIKFNNEILGDTPILGGKYFYIVNGNRNRTRTFQILISETSEVDKLWGLYDYKTEWN
ncbi:hypothetical protein [Acholeplasma hippikon]|uniref:Uncharacterized protein n=1 Tax=Acholeplasma hippikon TaxID=264636 RepID=A0A449BLM3_9MOLU|nr:hypothetical protein [Acholeplasma hippikon]VEU83336.1 Uncharacterised protein [Acholeplasma hippikon]